MFKNKPQKWVIDIKNRMLKEMDKELIERLKEI